MAHKPYFWLTSSVLIDAYMCHLFKCTGCWM